MLEIAVTHRHHSAVGHHALIVAVISPEGSAKVGCSRERYRRRHHMAHHLQFLTQLAQELQWLEETIDFGADRNAETEIENVVEAIGGVPDNGTGIRIPLLAYLAGVHAVIQGDVRSNVEILHHIKCRLDGHRVTHAVAPVLDQAFVQEVVLLGCQ